MGEILHRQIALQSTFSRCDISEVVVTTHGQLIAQPIKGAWIFSEPNTLAVLNNWVRRY